MSTTKSINDADALLIFSVGPVLCCAASVSVVSVMLPPVLHKPPGSDRNHPGVFRHSSGMVKVVDLRQRFGVDVTDWRVPGRMIVTEISGGHAGFLVDEILDVAQWPEHGWGALPALVPRKIFKRILLRHEAIYLYADFEDLFRCEENGYLRAHIKQLAALQRSDIDIQQYQNAVPAQIASNAVELVIPELRDTTALPIDTSINSSETSVPPRSALTSKPIQVKAPVTTVTVAASVSKKSSYDVRKENAAAVRTAWSPVPELRTTISNQYKQSSESAGHVESASVTSSIPTVQYKQDLLNNNIEYMTRETETTSTKSSWVTYRVPILFIILLLSAMFVLLNFNTSNHKPVLPVVDVKNQEQPMGNLFNAAQPELQANIEQDDEGLVITVDAEADEVLEAVPLIPGDSAAESNVQANTGILEKLQPADKIIVHVVMKGDTLWAIANLYVRNPWRYPELAKLSNIKNPHRIYPGNKVKIIKRVAGKKSHADQ